MYKIIVLFVMLFLLSSCSVFSPINDVKTTYKLNAVPHPLIKKAHRRIALLVTEPETDAFYNTTQIAYTTRPYQIGYFAKNSWAATPSRMLQPLLVQTLQQTRYFFTVSPSSLAGGQYNAILNTEILRLEQDFSQNPSQVHFALRAQLVNATTNKVIAAKQFSAVEIAHENTPYGGVIAANRAVKRVLKQIAEFSFKI